MQATFAAAGLAPEKEPGIHCTAGVRTTRGVVVTSLLGWDRVRNHDASMAEWANRDDTPLATASTQAVADHVSIRR